MLYRSIRSLYKLQVFCRQYPLLHNMLSQKFLVISILFRLTDTWCNHKDKCAVLNDIDKLLYIPTIHAYGVQQFRIIIRSQYYREDSENLYVLWFLTSCLHCVHTVASYEEADLHRLTSSTRSILHDNRDSFIITINMQHMTLATKYFVQRIGVFYIIVDDEIDFMTLHDILHTMWTRYNIYKNYILTVKGVFIYDPFEFDVNRSSYGKIIRYSGEKSLEHLLFSNMRGYPLRIQIFKSVYARPKIDKKTKKLLRIDGVDGKVAELLQQQMNFSINLQEPNPDYFGERDANGTYNGAIASIIKNEIDLCLTGFFVKDYMVPEMEFSVAVYDDKLCIYVPKAKRIPASILPVLSVRTDFWIGFISSAFVSATIWWIIRRVNLWIGMKGITDVSIRKDLKTQFIRIYIDTWIMWVRVNIIRYPPFYSERIFLISLCLVSVIFGAIFESSLATMYIHPMYYKDIHTLRELDESGLPIIYKYSSMADDLFFNETSPLFANLNRKLVHLKDLDADVILDVAQNGNKASVSRYTSLMFDSLHFIASKRIWIVPECPKYYTISYVMPKNAPWEETMNTLLLQFLSSGLIVKWINDMQARVDIKLMMRKQFEASKIFKVLTIEDLQLAFYVVLLGNIFAGILVLLEKCHRHRQRSLK